MRTVCVEALDNQPCILHKKERRPLYTSTYATQHTVRGKPHNLETITPVHTWLDPTGVLLVFRNQIPEIIGFMGRGTNSRRADSAHPPPLHTAVPHLDLIKFELIKP